MAVTSWSLHEGMTVAETRAGKVPKGYPAVSFSWEPGQDSTSY